MTFSELTPLDRQAKDLVPLPRAAIWQMDEQALALDRQEKRVRPIHILGASLPPILTLTIIGITSARFGENALRAVLVNCPIVLCMIPFLARVYRDSSQVRLSLIEQASLDDVDDPSEVPVNVVIVQDGVKTGTDIGMLIIEDGALAFMGRRTSFCLGSQDLLTRSPANPGKASTEPIYDAEPVYLRNGIGPPLTLYLLPAARNSKADRNKVNIYKLLSAFRKLPATEAKRQYPPFKWDPTQMPALRYRPSLVSLGIGLQIAFFVFTSKVPLPLYLLALAPIALESFLWAIGKANGVRAVYRAIENR